MTRRSADAVVVVGRREDRDPGRLGESLQLSNASLVEFVGTNQLADERQRDVLLRGPVEVVQHAGVEGMVELTRVAPQRAEALVQLRRAGQDEVEMSEDLRVPERHS